MSKLIRNSKMEKEILLAVPSNRESLDRHIINACRYLNVRYAEFDIYADDWMEAIAKINPDGCIYIPEFRYESWRSLFTERIHFIGNELKIPIYPQVHELDLYESKRKMSYWLKYNKVPHPRTWIFGSLQESENFIINAKYPIIFKTDFGNASAGVRRIETISEAKSICQRSFGNGYRIPVYTENRVDLINRAKAIVRPFYRNIRNIRNIPRDLELDVVLFQEMIDIAHEWRVIKVGDYYFGHEKVANENGFHSGSGNSKWTIPPDRIFDFARCICAKGRFNTMSLDIFESRNGDLLVNELQTVFGVIAKNQMYREEDGQLIGLRRYFDEDEKRWREEEGEFGQDYCYRLRIDHFKKILNNGAVDE